MTDRAHTLAERFLHAGIPLTLLLDLTDPVGLQVAHAAELAHSDVELAPAPAEAAPKRHLRSA
jgi:hypothetical protein